MNAKILLMSQYLKKMYEKESRKLLIQYGLLQIEMDILAFLNNHPMFDTARDIVEVRMLTKSNVSSAIDSLVQRGYLEKHIDNSDKRIIHLALTSESKKVVSDISDMQKRYGEKLVNDFSESEKEQFVILLDKMIKNVINAVEGDKKNERQ